MSDALTSIREAEEAAATTIEQARAEAEQIVIKAGKEARQERQNEAEKLETFIAEDLDRTKREAMQEAEAEVKERQQEIEMRMAQARERIDTAATYVVNELSA